MTFCQPCRELVARHRKAARWVAFFLALSLFLSLLGWFSNPVNAPGFCSVYP